MIELVMTIVIAAILVTLAAPSMASLYSRNRTKAAATLLQENIRQARYESRSIGNGQNVLFCAIRAGSNVLCSPTAVGAPASFANGWQWFIDVNNNGTFTNGTDTLLGRRLDARTNNIDLTYAPQLPLDTLSFTGGNPVLGNALPVFTFNDINAINIATLSYNATGRTTIDIH